MRSLEVLRQYWGHSSFRAGQQELIEAALAGKDALAVLPTGGGKSVCYQIPAILLDGICLVVTPLVALMQDQVAQLKERGLKAVAISGGISYESLDRLLDNCIYGDYQFLFLSPERLQQDLVQGRIKQMRLSLIAIDEAHCISQWGHDFRPSYSKLELLKELAPNTPIMALTATANERVTADITQQLHLSDPLIYKGSVIRSNISYQSELSTDKHRHLNKVLLAHPGSGIVYMRSRRGCQQLSDWLTAQGFEALPYHGGLTADVRKTRLELWKQSNSMIMVATNAFGMGIDKADVRLVVHMDLPESLESYYQEAGRAGRDGLAALACLLYTKDDLKLAKGKYIDQQPDLKYITKVYKKLQQYLRIAYGEGAFEKYQFDYASFCNDYDLPVARTYASFQMMDRLGILRLNPVFSQQTRIQFIASSGETIDFFEKNPEAGMIGQLLLRMYGGISETAVKVALKPLARQINRPERYIVEQLKFLASHGILELELHEADSEVTFLVPREDERSLNPYSGFIKDFHSSKIKRFNALLAYVENTADCRQLLLAHYFDERQETPCGVCDNCRGNSYDQPSEKQAEKQVLKELEKGAKTVDELVESLNFAPEFVRDLLQELVNDQLVVVDITNRFTLN